MEEEVRRILNRAVEQEKEHGLGTTIVAIFAEIGGVDLDVSPRSMGREAPDFSEVGE